MLRLLVSCFVLLVTTGCATTAKYNTQSAPEPSRAMAIQTQGEAPRPPTGAVVERYADHLFDGPAGQDFLGALSQGYRELARVQDNANDYDDAAKFLMRAGAAARGERFPPEPIMQRVLPAHALQDLIYARLRLMRALGRGADQRYPHIAARAQVAFDCWMEEQEENRVPDYVHECRRTFEAAMAQIEDPEVVVTAEKPKAAPPSGCTEPPATKWRCQSEPPVRIFFDLDQDTLTEPEAAKVHTFIERLKQVPDTVIVAAHADRSASDAHNDPLSKRRLDRILGMMTQGGIGRERIESARYYGKRNPPVPTPDGVREPQNRVVELSFIRRE